MATIFDSAIQSLADFGFFEVILPFVLIYAVTYGVLERTGILKGAKEQKKIHQLLAFTISFIAIASAEIVGTVTLVSIYAVMGLIVIVMLLILFSILGIKAEEATYGPWIVMFIAGIAVVIYLSDILGFRISWQTIIPIVITLAVFYGIIKFITGGEKEEAPAKKEPEKPKEAPEVTKAPKQVSQKQAEAIALIQKLGEQGKSEEEIQAELRKRKLPVPRPGLEWEE